MRGTLNSTVRNKKAQPSLTFHLNFGAPFFLKPFKPFKATVEPWGCGRNGIWRCGFACWSCIKKVRISVMSERNWALSARNWSMTALWLAFSARNWATTASWPKAAAESMACAVGPTTTVGLFALAACCCFCFSLLKRW